ncbi:MAG TPA: dynamin family protein [Candidatus Dormibacteraeota bacterium]|nr:dynamin family protein [Candidatus Dormibacteraeota bacterium]
MDGGHQLNSVTTLAGYERRRASLLDLLAELERILHRQGNVRGAALLAEAALKLRQERFTLAVLGQFKRGKSTLVNALLGEPVMPVGVTPVTAVPVAVEHAPEPVCTVRFRDGRSQRLPLERLHEVASERGNPRNHKGVAAITIGHPAEVLRHGLTLVDTPGTGSIHHHTEEVHAYLPRVDVAIFVLSVDSPAAEAELELLRRVRSETDRLFLVLNKADLLTPSELREAVEYVGHALEQILEERPPVFPLSARQPDRGLEVFRAELEAFLVRERATLLLEQARRRASAALEEALLSVEVEERALALSVEERERRLARLRALSAEARRRRAEVESHLEADLRLAIAEVLDRAIDELRRRGTPEVRAAVEETARAGGPHLARRLDEALRERLRAVVGEHLAHLERRLGERLAEIGRRHADEAGRLISEIRRSSAGLFDLPVTDPVLPTGLEAPGRFSFRLEDQAMGLEILATGLRRLLPGPLGAALTRREALRRAEEMVDRHAGRLRHDLVERLRAQERTMRERLGEAIAAAEFAVQGAVEAAALAQATGAEAVEQAGADLREQRARLESLRSALAEGPGSGTRREEPPPGRVE